MLDLYANVYSQPSVWMIIGLIILVIWDAILKSVALWFSAKNQQKAWFIVLIIFNTIGLLPLIYLLWFRPRTEKAESETHELEISEEPKRTHKKVIGVTKKPAKKNK